MSEEGVSWIFYYNNLIKNVNIWNFGVEGLRE